MDARNMPTFLRWIRANKLHMRSVTEVYDRYGADGLRLVKKAKSDGLVDTIRRYTGDGGYRLYVKVKGE